MGTEEKVIEKCIELREIKWWEKIDCQDLGTIIGQNYICQDQSKEY